MRHKLKMSEDRQGKENRGRLTDIVLLVEGHKIKANAGLLSYSSSVFATLIANARAAREAEDNDAIGIDTLIWRQSSPDAQRAESRLKLELPNQRFKDVKTLVECLESAGRQGGQLTDEKVFHILPLVDHFRISNLRKACKTVLLDSFNKKRKESSPGKLKTREVLKFLGTADTYEFETIRKMCIEELALHTASSDRKEVMYDKHITEKTKLKVMDKLCDGLSQDYENKLTQIRNDMDRRCREIEQRRDEFMEQVETWKNSLKQEVDDTVKESKDAHEELVKKLNLKKITDRLDATLQQTKEELFIEMKQIKDQMNFVFETMEGKEVIAEMEAADLRETLEEAIENNTRKIENITEKFKTNLVQGLKTCSLKKAEAGLASSYELEENTSAAFEDLESRIRIKSFCEIKLEEEQLAHDKTKAQLTKMKIKDHEINTWLKWAKPVSENAEKCVCFRHFMERKACT